MKLPDSLDHYAFDSFRVYPAQRAVYVDNTALRLGSRAFDILVLLIRRAGEVVTKEEIFREVWAETTVDEANLRVHIGALRKLLGETHEGSRYIANVPGRGYCFTGKLQQSSSGSSLEADVAIAPASPGQHNLPALTTRLVGRQEAVAGLLDRLEENRFVSVVGPGGIGKTSVVLAAGEKMLARFANGIRFVDLSSVSDPSLVAPALAVLLGLPVPAGDPTPGITAFLSDQKTLIVLDNCEHVIDETARLVEAILRGTRDVRIVATSREPIRASGEWILRLAPLDVPPEDVALALEVVQEYSSVRLFLERARAAIDSFKISPDDVRHVVKICRRLDGVPLAIELAAARVDIFGISGLASQFEDRRLLMASGRRSSATRHQTLNAMLNWSYSLLSAEEATVLCRLSCFRSTFTLRDAVEVCGSTDMPEDEVIDAVGRLSEKSLLSVDIADDVVRYRLLEATRIYAAEKLLALGEASRIARVHADRFVGLLKEAEASWMEMSRLDWIDRYKKAIPDVRAALDWAFSPDGDIEKAVNLVALSFSLCFQLSLFQEVSERLKMALDRFHEIPEPKPELEIWLNINRAFVLQQTSGASSEVMVAYGRAFTLSDQLGMSNLHVIGFFSMWAWAFGFADYRGALRASEQMTLVARAAGDEVAGRVADRTMAQALHFLGDHHRSRRLAERVIAQHTTNIPLATSAAPVDPRVSMRVIMARSLWMEGFPDQAKLMADEAVEFAENDTVFALFQALGFSAAQIALWRGDLDDAEMHVRRLRLTADRYSTAYWQGWASLLEKAIDIRRQGTERSAVFDPTTIRMSNAKLTDAAATFSAGMFTSNTLSRVESGTTGWCAAEVYRCRGESLLALGDQSGEDYLLKAVTVARQQAALSWELRATVSLAERMEATGRVQEAFSLLDAVLRRFTEGRETADLQNAAAVNSRLSRACGQSSSK